MRSERIKLTPPELARRWGVSPDKVLAWIRAKELRAINAALRSNGRPRYLIDELDIEDFERRRGVSPSVRSTRRKRAQEVIEFF
jgi:hypothetical protein